MLCVPGPGVDPPTRPGVRWARGERMDDTGRHEAPMMLHHAQRIDRRVSIDPEEVETATVCTDGMGLDGSRDRAAMLAL